MSFATCWIKRKWQVATNSRSRNKENMRQFPVVTIILDMSKNSPPIFSWINSWNNGGLTFLLSSFSTHCHNSLFFRSWAMVGKRPREVTSGVSTWVWTAVSFLTGGPTQGWFTREGQRPWGLDPGRLEAACHVLYFSSRNMPLLIQDLSIPNFFIKDWSWRLTKEQECDCQLQFLKEIQWLCTRLIIYSL